MSHPRKVMGLKWARLDPDGPFKGERPKATGKAAEGHRYQARIEREEVKPLERFGQVFSNQWIRFADTYGTHWCELDLAVDAFDRVVVIECKLSLRRLETGLAQLSRLYRPCVEHIFEKPVVSLLVFKHWVGPYAKEDPIPMLDSPVDAFLRPLHSLKQPHGCHIL